MMVLFMYITRFSDGNFGAKVKSARAKNEIIEVFQIKVRNLHKKIYFERHQ